MKDSWKAAAKVVLFVVGLLSLGQVSWAQLELSQVRGRAVDPQGARIGGAVVALLDQRGIELKRTTCDADGRFALAGVVPGSYYLKATSGSLVSSLQSLVVGNALANEIEVRLAPGSAETVVVTPDTELPALETRTSLSGISVQQRPTRLDSRGLRDAVASTPGWTSEDNGLIHARGVDDGFLYVVDGIPLYERFDTFFGVSPEAEQVASMNVLTGHLPAEFGLKAGGVIEINTGSDLSAGWSSAFEGSVASEDSNGGNARIAGPLGSKATITLYGSGETSNRFIDPVDPGNLHSNGSAYQGDVRAFARPSERDSLTVGIRYGHASFQVPNNQDQQAAGQDQRQDVSNGVPMISWQRSWNDRTVSQVAGFGFWNSANLTPSAFDTPISTAADRNGDRFGVLASVTHSLDRHVLKAGFEVSHVHTKESFSFFVTDPDEADDAGLSDGALEFTPENPFLFQGDASGMQYSVYAQDTWRALSNLVINFGLRFDRSALPSPETNWGPRFGLAYRPTRSTTLRASVDRYFQPPQLEWLLLSGSEQARVLSPFAEEGLPGGAPVPAEKQTAYEVGLEQWLGHAAKLSVDGWYRRGTDVDDPNVFFSSTIVFPNAVALQKAAGVDVRVDVPRRHGVSGFASYSYSKIRQYGPITGGLFLEDDFLDIGPGTEFTPDHDIRNVAVFGLNYQRRGFWAAATCRYQSGTPVEVDPDELAGLEGEPGADRVDLQAGRTKPRTVVDLSAGVRLFRMGSATVEAGAEVLNLTDAAYAFNFGNPFSGTHFGPPRTFAFKLRVLTGDHAGSPIS